MLLDSLVLSMAEEGEICENKDHTLQASKDNCVDFYVVLTGPNGSGKSAASNFLMKEEVFPSEWSLKPITTTPASCTRMVEGKWIQIVDTPGFLDPYSLSCVAEFKGLAKAVIDMPNGINAVGLIINIQSRVTKEVTSLLEKILKDNEMINYTFIIFTHAKVLGNTNEIQRSNFEKLLHDTQKFPEILLSVLKSVKNRFMLLESVAPMEPGYYNRKSQEFLKLLQGIMNQNKNKLFTCALNDFAKHIQKIEGKTKDELVEALTKDLQTMSNQQMKNTSDLYWQNLIYFVVGASAVAAGALFSSEITAGASELANFFTKKTQILSDAAKAASKYFH